MFEVLYRYDPGTTILKPMPETAEAALRELVDGNRAFAEVLELADAGLPGGRQVINLTAKDLGLTIKGDAAPEQLPFAAVLSCADRACSGRNGAVAAVERALCRTYRR